MKIPLVDLKAQLEPIRGEVMERMTSVLDQCNFILGQEVQQFEESFAQFNDSRYAIAVANGTDALHLAARAAGLGAGDEALVPANTFIATALGVTMAGAKPVPVDVDPETFLMDARKIKEAITPRTKAIFPVHLYGRMMDLSPILDIASRYGLTVIEDAAQAHGAESDGRRAGSVGIMGCFSFYPGKNLGCYGDGGLVTTDSPEMKARLESLRNYGSPKKYHHPSIGFNSRLDTLQAAVLIAKLPHLNRWNDERYRIANHYNAALEGVGDLILPQIPPSGSHVFHIYALRTKQREALLKFLNDCGIGASIHYPVPVHLHGAYADLGYIVGSFPVAEKLAGEILSLPIYAELTAAQIDYVTQQIKKFFKSPSG